MSVVHPLITILSWIVFIYLAANTLYLFVIAIAGRLIPVRKFKKSTEKSRIGVLIPCYKEDLIILDTALKAKYHDYPVEFFIVTVIADKLKTETVDKLRQIPVAVIEVDVNMKSRSLHAALETKEMADTDIVMILDADNIMADGCLEKVNAAYQAGAAAIQCHRTAKNKNTAVALLDAISEEININLFRRGPATIGLSAAPIGSGMAFRTALIRDIFSGQEILENPGEDREVDMQLMRRKIKMEFLDDALVFDEKVASAAVFEKQRVRWLEAQVNHFKRFSDADMKTAPRTFLYYNKYFQNLLLPRVLTLLVFCLIIFAFILEGILHISLLHPSGIYWISMIALYAVTLSVSVPASFYNMQTLRALAQVPVLMIAMVKALLQVKKKRTEFIHTPKSFTGNNTVK